MSLLLNYLSREKGKSTTLKGLPDGTYRDTVVFSILNSEWNVVKKSLEFKLRQ